MFAALTNKTMAKYYASVADNTIYFFKEKADFVYSIDTCERVIHPYPSEEFDYCAFAEISENEYSLIFNLYNVINDFWKSLENHLVQVNSLINKIDNV